MGKGCTGPKAILQMREKKQKCVRVWGRGEKRGPPEEKEMNVCREI